MPKTRGVIMNLEKLEQKLKDKLDELDQYISNPTNDIFSDQAENIRKEIYKLQGWINLLETVKQY